MHSTMIKRHLLLLLAIISVFIRATSGSQAAATRNLRAPVATPSDNNDNNNSQERNERLRSLIECDSRCSQPNATGIPIPYYYTIAAPMYYYSNWPDQNPYGTVPNCWDTSAVSDMSYGLWYQVFNERIDCWDTSNVTNMQGMFEGVFEFNQNINTWNVSKVTDMSRMFKNSAPFNQPLDKWDVSNVKNMSKMFSQSDFHQPLNNWNVSQVTDMSGMFDGNHVFNQPLDKWDVSNVQNMSRMFGDASSFNQPLNTWNVANVQNMQEMFAEARLMYGAAFSQNLCSWGIKATSLTNVAGMFSGSQCPYTQDPAVGGDVPSTWCTFCFGTYNAYWKNVGSNAQQSFTAGASWSNTTSVTYTGSFTASFSGTFEESAMFEGAGTKVSLTATESLTASVSETLSYAETHSWTYTCATPVCNNGVLFQLVVEAPASDGTTQSVQTCNFSCVPQSIPNGQPQCPLGFCSDNTCQCCNDLWLYGNSDPTANHLEAYNGNGGTCKSFCVGNDQPCDDTVTCCSGKCSKSGICQQNFSLLQAFH